jgi:hypothetical protein
MIWELMITEGNKHKRQTQPDPAFKTCFIKIKTEVLGNGLPYFLKERKYLIFW